MPGRSIVPAASNGIGKTLPDEIGHICQRHEISIIASILESGHDPFWVQITASETYAIKVSVHERAEFPSPRETSGERSDAVMPRFPPVGHDSSVVFLHAVEVEPLPASTYSRDGRHVQDMRT